MTRTSTQDLQEEFLTALSKGQQTMIGALRIWVETVQAVAPKLTSVYAPLTDKLPKLPNVTVPFADRLPSPKEAVGNAYGLAEELLANQRKFTEDVLATAAPLLPGNGKSGTSHAAPKHEPRPVPVTPAPMPKVVHPQPTTAEPRTTAVVPAPKAAAPKAPAPKAPAPKAATPKAPTPKAAPRKAATAKATPKATAPKRTPKTTPRSADAS